MDVGMLIYLIATSVESLIIVLQSDLPNEIPYTYSFLQRVLREEVKESLKWNVNRSSPSNKIRDLMEWTKDIMKDIAYQRKILSNIFAIGLTKGW